VLADFATAGQASHDSEIVVEGGSQGAASAWNQGAASARGEVLLFVRDNLTPSATLVASHARLHAERHDILGAQPVAWRSGGSGLADYLARHHQQDLARLFEGREDPLLRVCCGSAISVRRDRFRAAGGFGEGLDWGAEAELALRLTMCGTEVVTLAGPAGERITQGFGEIVAEAEAAGRASVELYRRAPALIRHLELGGFSASSASARLLRRALLAVRCPPAALRPLGTLMPGAAVKRQWHRFLYSYCYWRGVWKALPDRETRRRLAHGPVILMYHALGDRGERPGVYVIPVARFARQMAWLSRAGYRFSGMDELLRHRGDHRLPPARTVVVTFDDGYADNHGLAYPVLRGRGAKGTFFVVTRRLDETNNWDQSGELSRRPLLSRAQVREMIRGGMEIGAHSRHHMALPGLAPEELEQQVAGSRRDLEGGLALSASAFAYPYGLHDRASRDAAEGAGFTGACCSRSGVNDPVVPDYLLRRVEVRGTDSLLRFALAVWQGRAPRRWKQRP
jgi:peptidoglycan/xylan/chitin deacetylase (PgdA/CDA1 family)